MSARICEHSFATKDPGTLREIQRCQFRARFIVDLATGQTQYLCGRHAKKILGMIPGSTQRPMP